MKKVQRWFVPVLAIVALSAAGVLIFSCGGSSSSSSAPPAAVTRGVVTGFGSIFVNGVEYDTSASTQRLRPDDNTSNFTGLDNEVFRMGMVVTVRHRSSDNVASEIEFMDDLKGPIGAVSTVDNTFTVLGFTVKVLSQDNQTNGTYFDDVAGLAALAVGDNVEVSGLPAADGSLVATYVAKEDGMTEPAEVKGYVSGLNTTDNSFVLKLSPGATVGVTVTFTSATTLDDLPVGGLADNLFVEVKTSSTSAPLSASAIEGRRTLSDEGAGAAHVSVSGFVSGLAGTTPAFTFWVGAQAVETSSATTFGVTPANGVRVDVEGTIDANGVLQAKKVEPEL